jgi:hypothetical protein
MKGIIMTTIPTTKRAIIAFQKRLGIPRGATHFRLNIEGHNPIVETLKNLDVAAGCSGEIEFGKVTGRGRNRTFEPITITEKKARTKKTQTSVQPTPDVVPEKSPRKGTRHTILGHSACAVLKALGKAGVKFPEADAILKRHGIEMPKASVSVQLGFGRNEKAWQRHGQPAPLSDEEVAQLREQSAA